MNRPQLFDLRSPNHNNAVEGTILAISGIILASYEFIGLIHNAHAAKATKLDCSGMIFISLLTYNHYI